MSKRKYVVDIISQIIGGPNSQVTAELIVERLTEEGVLSLGYGDKDIDSVLETFKAKMGTSKSTKQDRFAANRLVKTHGAQAVVGVILLLSKLQDQPYIPVVGSVSQLESKWVNVIAFLRKQRNEEPIDSI